ncbi:hypothetical protein L1887_07075 [Cichorium endivia]|nr:hypothetical protein L1887_07075 [Cichorium endivia]
MGESQSQVFTGGEETFSSGGARGISFPPGSRDATGTSVATLLQSNERERYDGLGFFSGNPLVVQEVADRLQERNEGVILLLQELIMVLYCVHR